MTKGWTVRPSRMKGVSILSKDLPGASQAAEFILPVDSGFADENRRIADALRALAVIERRSEAEIAKEVRDSIRSGKKIEHRRSDDEHADKLSSAGSWAAIAKKTFELIRSTRRLDEVDEHVQSTRRLEGRVTHYWRQADICMRLSLLSSDSEVAELLVNKAIELMARAEQDTQAETPESASDSDEIWHR